MLERPQPTNHDTATRGADCDASGRATPAPGSANPDRRPNHDTKNRKAESVEGNAEENVERTSAEFGNVASSNAEKDSHAVAQQQDVKASLSELLSALGSQGHVKDRFSLGKAPGVRSRSRRPLPLKRRLARQMLETIRRHDLVVPNDRIMVAVSGGKDSYTLLELLSEAARRAPFRFELVAFHLDQGQPGYDGQPLATWLEEFGAPYYIHHEDTYSTVKVQAEEGGSSYCAPCSRQRRGILYTWAERLGCNKIALGHHREDTLETLLLNMLFSGRLQGMPPRYSTNDGRFEVIRPLLECCEADIAEFAGVVGYPILPCNLCGSQDGLKRVQVRSLLEQLESKIPNVREVILSAMGNVRPTHLLDAEVSEAWQRAADEFPPRR